jgi:threonyl-tRNA synthetase
MAVIGQREVESDSLALRIRGAGKKQEVLRVGDFLTRLKGEVEGRALAP